MIAEVITEVFELGRFNFTTRFSDGFEDTYSLDKALGKWNALRDKKSAYLKKIKDDLRALLYYQPNRHYLNFQYPMGQELVNIWIFETFPEDGCRVYSIYFKGDYRFDMKKMFGAWYARSVRNDAAPIDNKLVDRIGEMVEKEMSK